MFLRSTELRFPLLASVALLLGGVSPVAGQEPEEERQPQGTLQVTSPLGVELYSMRHDPGTDVANPDSQPAALAARKLSLEPESVEHRLELGVALARSWRYREAMRFYDEAIVLDPENWYAYRLRGHRYISLRQFDAAVADLEKAAALRPGDFDVWYHLGLAHYLEGEFDQAAEAYRRCLETVDDDDELVAVSHWLYMSLRRAGEEKAAVEVLEPIGPELEIDENASYYSLLRMYRGEESPEKTLAEVSSSELDFATAGYGVANWYLYNGERERAVELFEQIVDSEYWPAFGFIAAESDLVRLR